MKRAVLSIALLALMASIYGCSTVRGLGNDVATVGGWITKGSDHVEESVKKNPPGSGMEK